jgi:uncharacterized protein with ParB-like and HNH nuclease domain
VKSGCEKWIRKLIRRSRRPSIENCHRGVLQLPDFQRSWVWDEDRIKSLIASVSRAFPVGALMGLERGGPVNFKPRPIEGAPPQAKENATSNALPSSIYHFH